MKIVDGPFDYEVDQWSGRLSSCHLRVYQLADRVALVIATELTENRGPSITNSAEPLATQVVKEYDLDPARTYFVEHYDHRTSSMRDPDDTTYDFVEFRWKDGLACCAKWRSTKRQEIEKLIGEPLL